MKAPYCQCMPMSGQGIHLEVVVWLPLVDCYRTKAMYLLPPSSDERLREEFGQWADRSSEELFRRIENEVSWIEIKAGEVLIFNQNLPHGNRVNQEPETRWSMNCRFKVSLPLMETKRLVSFRTHHSQGCLPSRYELSLPQLPSEVIDEAIRLCDKSLISGPASTTAYSIWSFVIIVRIV